MVSCFPVLAAPELSPDRSEGKGPYDRLILRGVTIINGEGAPPIGPMDIVIEGRRIASIHNVGFPGVPIEDAKRPEISAGDEVLELEGSYVLPGFIDLHAHFGGDAQGVPAEYVAKLWMAHGITTIREPGSFNGLDWVRKQQRRSESNAITAPRIVPYVGFGQGTDDPFIKPAQAREWVRDIAQQGARGIKFFGADGAKLSDEMEQAIEDELALNLETVPSRNIGKVVRIDDAAGRYIANSFSRTDISTLRGRNFYVSLHAEHQNEGFRNG